VTEIRPARLADASALAILTEQLGYPVAADAMAQRLAAILAAPEDIVLVSCDDRDEPVGWIHVGDRRLLEGDPGCQILGLVVHIDHRRQGRAARLVEAAERWALERDRTTMTVGSNIIRAESHPFYERAGYQRVKTQHLYRKAIGPSARATAD
jgi:predicted N-acetyltransferase YhbS